MSTVYKFNASDFFIQRIEVLPSNTMNRTTESTVISSTVSYTTAVSTVTEGEDQRTVENLEQLSDAVLGWSTKFFP